MTQDDILRMAREAGATNPSNPELYDCVTMPIDGLERFADLVAAVEREACAEVCAQYNDDGGTGETWGSRFAALIRARSKE